MGRQHWRAPGHMRNVPVVVRVARVGDIWVVVCSLVVRHKCRRSERATVILPVREGRATANRTLRVLASCASGSPGQTLDPMLGSRIPAYLRAAVYTNGLWAGKDQPHQPIPDASAVHIPPVLNCSPLPSIRALLSPQACPWLASRPPT